MNMKMNMKSIRGAVLAAGVAVASSSAFAYWTPLQVNLAGVAGLPPAADSVYGIRVNALYGSCDTVAVLDSGLFNRTIKGAYGIRAGAINWSEGNGCGLSVGAFNIDQYNGGLTMGAINYAKKGAGVQIGVINIADEFTGVQVGVLNFHFNSAVPVFPLFNMGSGTGK